MTGFLQQWADAGARSTRGTSSSELNVTDQRRHVAPARQTEVVPSSDVVTTYTVQPTIRPARREPNYCTNSEEPAMVQALDRIASLLAAAYRRYSGIRRMPVDESDNLPGDELALSTGQSVHECDAV